MSRPADSETQDRLLEHSYDGIQEYDNPLPRWWTAFFVGSFVFAVVYGIYYHLGGPGMSEQQEYQAEVAAHIAAMAKRGGGVKVDEQMLATMAQNETLVASVKPLFVAKCAQCHGKLGEGIIGPNLTDDYWLHGAQLTQIYQVIDKGVPAKGMQAWGKLLKPGELINLAAYVGALRGTTPPKPKAPQGKKVVR